MANETAEPQELETLEDLLSPEGGSRYEKYKRDGVYEYGVLPNGKRDKSRVKITYNAGDVFEGILKHGKYVGTGKYRWKDGGAYEGNFKNGKPSGCGEYAGVNGDSFTGDFKDGAYNGNGKYVWADGSFYEGSFENGRLLNGRFTDASGNVYACSYSYNRNGERKSGEVRLIRKAVSKVEEKPAAKEQAAQSKQTEKKKDDGLQNKDRVLLTRIRQSAADKAASHKAGYSKCYVDYHLTGADGKGRIMHGARWDLGDGLTRKEHISNADVAEIEKTAETGAIPWEIKDDEPTVAADGDFAKQVDAVLSGADTTSTHVKVMDTPSILLQVGASELPVVMTAEHLKSITRDGNEKGKHNHGLAVSVIKQLPELLSDPVMVMDSLTRSDSVVLVTDMTDKQGNPVIAAVKFNGLGYSDNEVVEANILTSTYGKDRFTSFIQRNVEAGTVLYCNKEKAERMSVNLGVQSPNILANLSFDTIIRKARAFVNTSEQKKSENFSAATSARSRVEQVRAEMVNAILSYMEKNPTWERGWSSMEIPQNGRTGKEYRGFNSLYLYVLGEQKGYKDPRWVTFKQAQDIGASVKKGEKGAAVLFFQQYDRKTKKEYDPRTVVGMTDEEAAAYQKENVSVVMRYSTVFNAEQCDNFPEMQKHEMSEEERSNRNSMIETIISNSAAPVLYDGGTRAYYAPGEDKIHLPKIEAFRSMQDYYATALHEIAHSTGASGRLNRDLTGGFGSESYALEELRAELACVFMQTEQGIKIEGKHIENHAAYLKSWLSAGREDPKKFYAAVRDAEKISDYVAENYLAAIKSDEADDVEERIESKEPTAEARQNAERGNEKSVPETKRKWIKAELADGAIVTATASLFARRGNARDSTSWLPTSSVTSSRTLTTTL